MMLMPVPPLDMVDVIRSLVDDSDHLVKRKLKTIRIIEEEGMYPAPASYYQGVLFCTARLQTKRMP
jgi:hypothetical protein